MQFAKVLQEIRLLCIDILRSRLHSQSGSMARCLRQCSVPDRRHLEAVPPSCSANMADDSAFTTSDERLFLNIISRFSTSLMQDTK